MSNPPSSSLPTPPNEPHAPAASGAAPAGAAPPAGDDSPPHRYTAALANQIEARWQDRWDRDGVFRAPNPGEAGFDATRPKQFVLDMFPYPSGIGLHVGHPLGYIATDIYARFLRMTGCNVLHAMGYDAFGLPAEQYALQTNTHPRVTTEANIANMRKQLRRLGLAHDPRRSVSTTDPAFYKWTQWIFLQIYNSWYDRGEPLGEPAPEGVQPGQPAPTPTVPAPVGRARPIAELISEFESGKRPTRLGKPWARLTDEERRSEVDARRLAFLAEVPVNWCPMLGTVLANEEVIDGRSERGNYPVYRRPLKQWMMRITEYAERLLTDLEPLAWPEPIKIMQRNWIGRSEGAYVDFDCAKRRIRVFTTRPDTLFGATYMVLSPEHPMVDEIMPEKFGATVAFKKGIFPGAEELLAADAGPAELVSAYRAYARDKSDVTRQEAKEKTGVFTGAYAVNPVNQQRIPVFLADYVLSGYGTGAIMAVPAHDDRDFEFADEFGLPIRDVVYDRPAATMLHYALLVDGAHPPEAWREELADILGLSTSTQHEHHPIEELVDTVRRRRLEPSTPVGVDIDSPGGLGRQRGAVRQVWLDALEELNLKSFDDLRTLFREGGYYRLRGQAFGGLGIAANSAHGDFSISGVPTVEAKRQITARLERTGFGKRAVTYKLHDWLFSRQRYWGEPFPIVFDERGVAHALPESALPVLLPHVDNFQPASSDDPAAPVITPLGRAAEWTRVRLDLGDGEREYTRETNTMPNWAGSCWYYLRYLDPENAQSFVSPEVERYWMRSLKDPSGTGLRPVSPATEAGAPGFDPALHHLGGVDLYVGGVEHAVLHLLYARFWHKVLFDLGHVSTPEPFGKLFNQGYIQAAAYTDARGAYVEAAQVEEREKEVEVEVDRLEMSSGESEPVRRPTRFFLGEQPVFREYGKMGKSLKNAVSPDEVCAQYGCDTMRIYEMSMGPLEASKPWNTRDIAGAYRFLQRVWRNIVDEQSGELRVAGPEEPIDAGLLRLLHKTIGGVRNDYQTLGFNTAVAKLIEFNNELTRHVSAGKPTPRPVAEALVLMLAPLAPHMAEELWSRLGALSGRSGSLAHHPFPEADPALAADDQIEIPVQVLGKLRGKIMVPAGADAQAIEAAALADEGVRKHIEGRPIKKVIVVPGKMVNVVVG